MLIVIAQENILVSLEQQYFIEEGGKYIWYWVLVVEGDSRQDEVGSVLLSKLKIYKIETRNWQDKEDEIKRIAAYRIISKV